MAGQPFLLTPWVWDAPGLCLRPPPEFPLLILWHQKPIFTTLCVSCQKESLLITSLNSPLPLALVHRDDHRYIGNLGGRSQTVSGGCHPTGSQNYPLPLLGVGQ